MKTCHLTLLLIVTVLLANLDRADLAADEIDFNRDVRPILSNKCFHCHGPDPKERQADLRLDNFEGATADLGGYAAVVPKNINKSELVNRIEDAEDPMPPEDSKLALSEAEKKVLRDWIEGGAKFDQHWSLTKPVRPAVPDGSFSNPIDGFIAQKLNRYDLKLSPEATPERLIRRLTLDLTGLPPTIDEIHNFVKAYSADPEPTWSKLIDRLLDSPRYGETMALPWLDAARFADTDGYQYDGPRFQWRWRDWVIQSYNKNMPFDQFTIEQLAGDLIPNATLDQVIATGFNRNHRYNSEAGLVVEEFLLENAVDRVDTTATLWMGLTAGCARCHDHKYDPISQKDYYQLIAFFNSIPEAGRAIKSGNSEPTLVAPTKQQQAVLFAKERELAKLKNELSNNKDEVALENDSDKPLIDRKLVRQYLLDSLPKENVSKTGKPSFSENALELDGESSVALAKQPKEINLRANSTFSISFWLNPAKPNGVILSRQNPGQTRPGVELSLVDGKFRFDLITRWFAGTGQVTTREQLKMNRWVHVAITNDGSQSARGQLVYINGKISPTDVSVNTNSNVGGVSANRPLVLGKGVRPNAAQLSGAIRDLRLYKTALWPEEVAVLNSQPDSTERKRYAKLKSSPKFKEYQDKREALIAYRKKLPSVMVMKESAKPKTTYLRKRGVYNDLGEIVERNVPSALPQMDKGLPRNRLGLAKWLVSPDHPLTARVAVNRYWQKYFGQGLVKTAEDFGIQGDLPSHPQLLDWLATEFIASGWDIAHMQKLIVSSKTYRQSSRVLPRLLQLDPDNRLVSRGPRLRLSAHVIRDQALFVSGLLHEQIGGPSVSPYQPAKIWAEMSMGMRYKQSKGKDLYRRSLYTIWKRTVAPPAMAIFDAADREACWVNRKETNTPLQALTLLNETGFVESSRKFAERLLSQENLRTDEQRIQVGFQMVTGRKSKPRELSILISALNEYRIGFKNAPKDAEKLLQVGESKFNSKLDPIEIASYATLSNVLLNLDESINKE